VSAFLRGLELQQGVHRLSRRSPPVPAPMPAQESESHPPPTPLVDVQAQLQESRAQLLDEQRSWRQQAEQELAALREKVAQEGHATGQALGLAEASEAYRQKLQQADALIDRLGALLGEQLVQSQDLVVAIAFEAVTKILGEAAATPEGVRAVVAQAMEHTRQREKLVVRVPAEDYRLLIEDLPATHPLARPGIEIRPDAQLSGGGCVIEADAGQLDATLATQLAALRTVLLQARRQDPGGHFG
jgi:flagellar biosynthesis/type III secretory pathway protein FliH